MKLRSKPALLVLLLALGLLYRFFSAYPMELGRFAPASSALQAMHILDGARPIFYSGQSWMGPAGAYLIAVMFKLFGASSWTLGLFSLLMSALFLGLSVLLAHRLFGIDNALAVAALFLVPVDQVMYLAGQPRAHYTVTYVLVPLVLLATVAVIRRHRAGGSQALPALGLGLLSGFAFWTNMAVGPAIAVSGLLLLVHLRPGFFTRALPAWTAGFAAGVSPVIWYNLTQEAALAGQVAAGSRHFGRVVKAFFVNAWPRFWGVDWRQVNAAPLRLLFAALVIWIGVLFAYALFDGWRRWRRGEDVLGYQLVFGYLAVHLAVTSASHYGQRFAEGSNPTGYIVALYAVAFSVPALVLAAPWSRRAKALALAPLALFVANNAYANRSYPQRFFATVAAEGLSRTTPYPNDANPFVAYARGRGHAYGYLGASFGADKAKYENFPMNLEGFGRVAFADPAAERYVANALATDAERDPFWVKPDPALLRTVGATSEKTRVGRWDVHDRFSRELRELAVVRGRVVPDPADPVPAALAADRDFATMWGSGYRAGQHATLVFALDAPVRLREIVLFPADVDRSPGAIVAEVSDDGAAWQPAFETRRAAPMFWSVFHPFLKSVKPRLQITLPDAPAARFVRLRFALDNARRGVAIREALFLADGPPIDAAAWARDVDEVVAAVRAGGRSAVVAADHWFVDFFRREGFPTDFISNESFNDFGQREPNLAAPVPLALARPHRIIVERPHLGAVGELLRARGVAFREVPFRYFAILETQPAAVDPPLYWNGLELDSLSAGVRPAKR
jgi:hypothetical protein